jgi:signal peptide peptidase SppA
MILAPHIASRIFDVPLMIDAGKAAAILRGIGGRIVDGGMFLDAVDEVEHTAFSGGRPSMGRLGDQLGRRLEAAGRGDQILQKHGSVAVLAVEGTLIHKGKFLGASSGETSYEGLQTQISRATRDPSVLGAVVEVDTFGGEVAGVFDTAAMLAQLSALKPTLAILTDHALSAGYLLASAARQIIMPETGRAGSIGVIMLHADYSAQLEKRGVKVTVLASGAHKADGNSFEPLAAETAARIRADLDTARDLFAAAVAQHRGARLTKAKALATEAQHYRGEDAVAAGLVDAVMRPTDAFDAFVSAIHNGRKAI